MSRTLFPSLFFVIMMPVFCNTATAQNRREDSLRTLIEKGKDDTNKLKTIYTYVRELNGRGDDSTALAYLERGLSIARKIDDKKRQASMLNNMANIYWGRGDFQNALKAYTASLDIKKKIKDKKGIELGYGNIGNVYGDMGNFPMALQYYFKALAIGEELHDTAGIGRHLGNLGNIYFKQGDIKSAMSYAFRDLDLAQRIHDTIGITTILGNISGNYSAYQMLDSARYYADMAKELCIRAGLKEGLARTYGKLGTICQLEGNLNKALYYFMEDLRLSSELGSYKMTVSSLGNIGNTYALMHNYPLAEKYLLRTRGLADSIHSLGDVLEANLSLSELYESKGDYARALPFYKSYIAIRDSLFNQQNTKKQTRLEMQYTFDKKTTTDSIRNAELKKREDLKHEQEIQQQRIYSYGGAIGFLLMLIVAIVSIRAYRQKQKANDVISHQKAMVEEKQKEILDSIHYAKRIQKSLLPTEKYLQRSLQRLKTIK